MIGEGEGGQACHAGDDAHLADGGFAGLVQTRLVGSGLPFEDVPPGNQGSMEGANDRIGIEPGVVWQKCQTDEGAFEIIGRATPAVDRAFHVAAPAIEYGHQSGRHYGEPEDDGPHGGHGGNKPAKRQ